MGIPQRSSLHQPSSVSSTLPSTRRSRCFNSTIAKMSDMKASVAETKTGFHVEGYEKIEYDFSFIDGVFDKQKGDLADCFKRWRRCLAVMDMNIYNVYGKQMQEYFDHHGLELKIHKTMIGEKAKSIETFLSIVDSMPEFGIIRKEPVLVVGGGLVTDVVGFACAAYRRNTNYIRIPTTVIGLIDASVSIKVAVNYGNYKNRLGAYHAPQHTFLDFAFLRTLPEAQIRNGFAELIKISSCAHLPTFDLLDKYCEQLIGTGFGRMDHSTQEVRDAADKINWNGIYEMLKLETPNLHEIGLDRVITYGHTWSPLHELVPEVPLRHGHAISIDMAYSATLANQRGLLSDQEHRRLLNLFSRAGLFHGPPAVQRRDSRAGYSGDHEDPRWPAPCRCAEAARLLRLPERRFTGGAGFRPPDPQEDHEGVPARGCRA